MGGEIWIVERVQGLGFRGFSLGGEAYIGIWIVEGLVSFRKLLHLLLFFCF